MPNKVLGQHDFQNGSRLEIVEGDITQEAVDAIVNAANSQLIHGGGLAAVISQRAGRILDRESAEWVRKHGPVLHTEPAYTSGGALPARYVIHAVGPIWGSGDEDQKLAQAVNSAFQCAAGLMLGTLALPAISTGIFGFPKGRAAGVIFKTIRAYVETELDSTVKRIRLVLFDTPTIDAFLPVFQTIFNPTP